FQSYVYNNFGLFYERKKGEFGEGLRHKYIDRSHVLKREDVFRSIKAVVGKPSEARSATIKKLFDPDNVSALLKDSGLYGKYMFGVITYRLISEKEKELKKSKSDKYGVDSYGNAFRYGKYAVVSACSLVAGDEYDIEKAKDVLEKILSVWLKFEDQVAEKTGRSQYFQGGSSALNYYKSSKVDEDILEFFKLNQAEW